LMAPAPYHSLIFLRVAVLLVLLLFVTNVACLLGSFFLSLRSADAPHQPLPRQRLLAQDAPLLLTVVEGQEEERVEEDDDVRLDAIEEQGEEKAEEDDDHFRFSQLEIPDEGDVTTSSTVPIGYDQRWTTVTRNLNPKPPPLLFPFDRLALPYARYLHQKQSMLTSPHSTDEFNCIMQHNKNCRWACADWNCADSARLILQDFTEASSRGIFPLVPMHPEIHRKVKMYFLDMKQVTQFFEWPGYPGGILKVDEYCDDKGPTGPTSERRLNWHHAYVIERYASQCYLMQSDQEKFSVGHFLRPDPQDFPHPAADSDVISAKRRFGYHTEHATGESCASLFADYRSSYPELSAMKAYQENCLHYYAFKGRRLYERDPAEGEKILHLVRQNLARLKKKPGRVMFRQGTTSDPLACHDNFPVSVVWSSALKRFRKYDGGILHAGRTLAMESLQDGMSVQRFHERSASISGRRAKCTAIASVPDN